ncbi:SDR family oxidoreductase, partial [Candidatus Pelagibacter ubique]|nr:SDR family oxidoreductase [Candidatus Pelagibacter ubique]
HNFIKYSLNKNIKVSAISRKKSKLSNRNLKWIVGRFNEIDLKKVGKFDILIHFASEGTKTNERNNLKKNFEVNVFDSKDLILNAIKNNCKKFMIISSSSEFGIMNINTNGIKRNDFKLPNDSYGLSKLVFNNIVCNYSKKYKCKFRIMRLFPVYGDGENQGRLYSTIKRCAKDNSNLFLKNPFEIRDFSHVDFVVKNLFDALNFNKKKFKYHQTYHVSESNRLSILEFSRNLWKRFNCSGKIIYKNKKKQLTNHISHRTSNWRL